MPTFPSDDLTLAVTLGDPAGIGPEVALKALHQFLPRSRARVLLLGKEGFYRNLAKTLRLPVSPRISFCFDREFPKKIVRGRSGIALSRLAARSIELAVSLAIGGRAQAIVTAPVNKAGLKKAGFDIPGHTELLATLSKTKRYEMMLVGGPLRVVPVTRHMALKDVPGRISAKRVEEAILLTDRELRGSFGVKKPRIVVCGLNPHAGEEGNFGREEIQEITPGVRAARKKTDAEIVGPLSPDALFYDAYRGRYDAQICMYHDQGLIPLKMISRGAGVNVTLGLPFVRTSPDHGTAYDIAGKFRADPGSMREALELAVKLCENRFRLNPSGRLRRPPPLR